MSSRPIPLVLKFEDWPIEDQRLWDRCFRKAGLFSLEVGSFASWSNGTRKFHAQGYGSWLSFIARRCPDLIEMSPASRATLEVVGAYVEEGRKRLKLRSLENQLVSLATVLQGFGPTTDFRWVYRAADRLSIQRGSALKPPLPISAAQIFGWSIQRLSEFNWQGSTNIRQTAVEFRQALSVGLLIACPVRVRAFVSMKVDQHVQFHEGHAMLTFDPADMKNKKARRIPVPAELAPFLREYLDVHRPRLLGGRTSDALWISGRGNALNQDSFTGGLVLLTRRAFGLTLRPHAFRHVAATSIAIEDPSNAGIIRDILGHSNTRMAELHYNRATTLEVSQKQQEILRSRRNSATKRRKARRSARYIREF